MIRRLILVLSLAVAALPCAGQTSFVVLGDLHLDKFDFHDMDYVHTRPSDWKQVTKEYPYQTAAYMPKLFAAVGRRVEEGCSAIVQLGDLMEGVSGNEELATQMCEWAVGWMDSIRGDATVVLTKGNHDVSNSPGQPQAWKKVVLPYVCAQSGQQLENAMYRYSPGEDVDLFVAEQFFSDDEMLPETALLDFLKRELPASSAKYRFLLTHQPVIPVTERCWHLFSGIRRKVTDPSLRTEFLELLAQYKVTVLCAHLHKYSIAVRSTDKGNVVQLMTESTVHSFDHGPAVLQPMAYITPERMDKDWQPHTLKVREEILKAEYPFIKYYAIADRPGYAVVRTGKDGAFFSYYSGYSDQPSQTVRLDDLYLIR